MGKKEVPPVWDNGEIGAHNEGSHPDSITFEDLRRRAYLRARGKLVRAPRKRKKKKPILCSTAQRYIRYYFFRLNLISPFELTRLAKALAHIETNPKGEPRKIHCQRCLKYYQMKERKHYSG